MAMNDGIKFYKSSNNVVLSPVGIGAVCSTVDLSGRWVGQLKCRFQSGQLFSDLLLEFMFKSRHVPVTFTRKQHPVCNATSPWALHIKLVTVLGSEMSNNIIFSSS
ncbi:hypothetical protein DD238_003386 [Peronospora effusa]|uniref:Uncharacterized protein n=1 Tax=Peronospora effusa TaxID=542832 RepID=A0A3M6VQL9_9STRA|nr:hypothetical protein DD238_003386 [Peronospora effusa]RQM11285.1 hypothetical protein DD237_000817 [Peronospora effusa]